MVVLRRITDLQMKKIILSLLLILCVLPATAKFRWGPEFSLNVSNFYWKQKLIETNQKCGFNAGVKGELMIPGIGFGVDLGLRYNLHGARVNFGEKEVWAVDGLGDENVWLHTVQIPISLKFKWTRLNGLESIVAPFAYAGPVFSFTVGSNDIPAIEKPTGSVAIQCGLGAELWRHIQISAGYYWGVTYEIQTIKLDNFSARPQGWNVNLTYLF